MSESTPDSLCTGVHNNEVEGICHGANESDPSSYCSQPNCHGSDISGGNTGGPSCYSCHGPYWEVLTLHTRNIFGVKHGRDVCTASGFVSACGSDYCHTAALTGGTGYMKSPGCDKCHGIPTADGSNCTIPAHNSNRHVCASITTCATAECHGTDLGGGTAGAFPARGCARSGCHEHTPSGDPCEAGDD